MTYEYMIADVFTDVALKGNPLAVYLDAAGLSPRQMQRIAREMNLSETAFILPPENGGDALVRIFTPVNELPFAGHPILGTSIVLAHILPNDILHLETAMGTIPIHLDRTARSGVISASMQQPIPVWESYSESGHLLEALGIESPTLPVTAYRNGPCHVFVGLRDEESLTRVRPDLRALAEHKDMAANVFAPARGHWRMRMFSPAYGVAEDAATGSAAGPLAIHLARHGLIEFGERIEILQGVEMGRPSHMFATAHTTEGRLDAVEVSGSAVVIARGTLLL
ncbi:PhzF family phenazine biosynthesis protein [Kitasatospora purpeofusca]|uniref:PhzF family phenazine biosynthesis protein n=1 Tax=Kitasatospora purpeofusca TaxID=67352 RepID=UPI0036C06EC3